MGTVRVHGGGDRARLASPAALSPRRLAHSQTAPTPRRPLPAVPRRVVRGGLRRVVDREGAVRAFFHNPEYRLGRLRAVFGHFRGSGMNRGSKRCREGMTRLVARRDDEGRGFVVLTTHQIEQWTIGAPSLRPMSPVMEALVGAVPSNPSGLCLGLDGKGQILPLDKENAKGTRWDI